MSGEPDLAAGATGEWVTYLQQHLNHHYQASVVAESGTFDDATGGAVTHLRQQNGLADGADVDASVWSLLIGDATPAGAGSGAAGPATATATAERTGSTESREREREIGTGTRDHQPGDLDSWFQSDWAGRAILARWLAGDGDWRIEHDQAWTQYMRANEQLRHKLEQHARYVIANAAALGDEEGVIPVNEQFHVDIENGEGIVGYQYLHGSNATVGDFQISGWARLVPTAAPPGSDPNETGAARRVHWHFEYQWNDMIDPNAQYGTDSFKSAVGYFISVGSAQDYQITIIWSGEGVATVDGNGAVQQLADHSDSGDPLDDYPLR